MADYNYLIRRKFFKVFGAAFHIFDAQDNLIGFASQKALKLKEDIRIFTDETRSRELIRIKARNIIDFSAKYDVFDPQTEALLGTWKRDGISGFIRDRWTLLDSSETCIGTLLEDSLTMAMVRRFACNMIPQSYTLKSRDDTIAVYSQKFNPVIQKMTVTQLFQTSLNPMLILAGGILLMAIEERQD